MKRFQQIFALSLCLYFLYAVKSGLGINVSQRYHAIDVVKIPARFLIYTVKGLNPFAAPSCILPSGSNES